MVLEATCICVDNSEFMRNGDVLPSRLQAQADAVNLLAGAKTQANPESCVGILSLAGKVPKMLVTPTPDLGKVLNSMHGMGLEGHVHLLTGVQVAMLALKHRQNKNQRQRVVLFCGSPVEADEEALVKLGKKLKKNNVALDVVAFANTEANEARLAAFVAAANSGGNSNLVVLPPDAIGQGLNLADALISSPVFQGEDGGGGSGFAAAAAAGAAAAARQMGGGAGGFEFDGVDPTLDPELALALRVSMEEERARQEAAARGGEGGGDAAMAEAGHASLVTPAPAAAAAAAGGDPMMLDEDALLQQALAMSMMEGEEGGAPAAPHKAAAPPGAQPTPGAAAAAASFGFEDDPELALAMEMSMREAEEADAAGKKEGEQK